MGCRAPSRHRCRYRPVLARRYEPYAPDPNADVIFASITLARVIRQAMFAKSNTQSIETVYVLPVWLHDVIRIRRE